MNPEATERWEDRSISKSGDGWTAVRAWDVIDVTNEFEALALVGVRRGDAHPLSFLMRAETIEATSVSPVFYKVRATYQLKARGQEEPDGGMRIRWESVTNNEAVDRDADGNPIINSAQDPFDPPITRDFTDKILAVTRPQPLYDPIQAEDFENTVNRGPLVIAGRIPVAIGQLRCLTIQTQEYAPSDEMIQVEYRFHLRKDGHKKRVLDQGFGCWYSNGNFSTKGELYTAQGTQISKPKLLNGKGLPLDISLKVERKFTPLEVGTPVGAELDAQPTAAWLKWQTYPSRDFTRLGL